MTRLAVMTTQKVSVTLEADAIARARRVAGRRGLSSYLDAALSEKLAREQQRRALLDYLDALEASDPTPQTTKRRAAHRASQMRERVAP